jgi:hypothetical protein
MSAARGRDKRGLQQNPLNHKTHTNLHKTKHTQQKAKNTEIEFFTCRNDWIEYALEFVVMRLKEFQ